MKKILIALCGFVILLAALAYSTYYKKNQGILGESEVFQGIDVSHYQDNINWKKVKDSGVIFAYIKVSEGIHSLDRKFSQNWHETAKMQILRGGYHFFEPDEDAEKQARLFLNKIQKNGCCNGTLPPALDVEVIREVDKAKLEQGIRTWLRIVEDEIHCKPIIYTDSGFWNQYLGGKFTDYKLWLAEYSNKVTLPIGWKRHTFWQFASDKKITGILGNVDKNKFVGTKAEFKHLICP